MLVHDENGRPIAMRPMLEDPVRLMKGHFVGYINLDRDEADFAKRALSDTPDHWAVWYRALNLYDSFFRRDLAWTDIGDANDAHKLRAWEVQLRFCAAGIGAVKTSLEATLTGRYAQSFAMIRFIIETWERVEYLNIKPDMATAWVKFKGQPLQNRPADKTIDQELLKCAKSLGKDFQKALTTGLTIRNRMNGGAHPGPESLWQTLTTPTTIAFSGTHDPRLLIDTWYDGVWAALTLANAMSRLAKFDPTWAIEYIEINNEYVNLSKDSEATRTNATIRSDQPK